jgi:hypothetical protein
VLPINLFTVSSLLSLSFNAIKRGGNVWQLLVGSHSKGLNGGMRSVGNRFTNGILSLKLPKAAGEKQKVVKVNLEQS